MPSSIVKQVTQLVSLGRRLEIRGSVPTASPVKHTPDLGSIQLISRVTEDSSRPGGHLETKMGESEVHSLPLGSEKSFVIYLEDIHFGSNKFRFFSSQVILHISRPWPGNENSEKGN